MQLTLDFTEATRRKEAGLAIAEAASDPNWEAEVRQIVSTMAGEFMAEDVRALCRIEAGSPKHWGAVFRVLAKEGVIVATGYRACSAPRTKGHPARTYRLNQRAMFTDDLKRQ